MKEPRKHGRPAGKLVPEPVLDRATHWEVPEPRDTAEVHLADGGTVLLRRHGNPNGPRIVLSHGNGFSTDAYLPFWSLLLDRFDVVIYDLRNHGRNPLVDLASHHMPMMVWDNLRVVRAVDRHFGAKPKIWIYHSLSAAIDAYQTIEESSFAAPVLFDPPICPPGLTEARRKVIRAAGPRVAERTRGRQKYFADWEELAKQMSGARAFERLVPGAVDLLARTTLRRRADADGLELCCPPEFEARLFDDLYKWSLSLNVASLECPIEVIGGDPMVPFSFLPSVDIEMMMPVDFDFIPDTTHLLLLEEPEACARLTVEFLEQRSLA